MSPELVDSHYGKSRIRLLKVARFPDHHVIHDWTVDLSMHGDFDAAFVTGDNRHILPTDSMKNTVYALAHGHAGEGMEPFGRRLVGHFLHEHPQISQVRVAITAPAWEAIVTDGAAHPHAFCRRSGETRVAEVSGTRETVTITSGIEGLAVTKTAGSRFEGFAKDQFTTLADETDRVLATEIHARWTYREPEADYNECWEGVRRALLERFATHESASLQQTLHSLASAVLESSESITDIRISMPNRHCLFVDLASFGLENDGEIFMPTEAPYGLIEARLART
jgi:urate oxidase